MNLMRGIDLKKIAEKMNGASGAELKVCFMLDDCICMDRMWSIVMFILSVFVIDILLLLFSQQ